ncbi:MAG TPA: protein kinase [Thermoanaerobaculia bacterium]|nr:protein kinase [Thermoanaerobaculia bacterium]
MLPETLSHYRIIRKIAEGGMGEVYLAEDLVLGRNVAVKILPSDRNVDEERIRRFRQEARVISALSHPNVVVIHELGQEGDIIFIVTEYVSGATLRQLLTRSLVPGELLDIGIGIAAALQAAHEAGIVHRDVKPENIMIADHGGVKLLDFGLAKLLSEEAWMPEQPLKTSAGEVMGTIPYMAPEQVRGELVDSRSDIFGFGVVLFEMFCGSRPFDGPTTHATIAAILERHPAAPPRFMQLAAELRRLLLQMLSKARADRPATDIVAHQLRSIRRSIDAPAAALRGEEITARMDVFASSRERVNNLPAPAAPMIGREVELGDLLSLLLRPEVRLVTVTGTGGAGKTRLAIEAGHRLLRQFDDGVILVSLASVADASLVPAAIAEALVAGETEGKNVGDRVLQELTGRNLLLILDNFEHVADAATFIASLLTATDRFKILATSQLPLNIRWEHELALAPLPVPLANIATTALGSNPAVALFVEHAVRIKPGFVLSDDNAAAIATICRAVDGLPLAIELAAARVKLLTPQAIVERLADPLALLTGGARDRAPRQQAMRRAIEWSSRLLTEEEQRYFRRLAIFSGGSSLEAAEKVCDIEGDGRALEAISSLLEKSLLRREESPGGDVRLFMYETIRAFARESLAAGGESMNLGDRHEMFFTALAETADMQLGGAGQPLWLQRVESDHANFRSAISWALRQRHGDNALRIAGSLWRFWNIRGRLSEGRQLLDEVLAGVGSGEARHRKKASYAAAVLADAQGDFDAAYRHFSETLRLSRSLDDPWGTANALNNLGITALRRGDLGAARTLQEESLGIWRSLGENELAVALSLQNLGNVARAAGDLGAARSHYEEARRIFERAEDRRGVAWSLDLLAGVMSSAGDTSAAREVLEQSLSVFIELQDHWAVGACLADLGDVYRQLGNLDEARSLLQESLQIFRELGDLKESARILDLLAITAADRGRPRETLMLAGAATAIRRTIGSPRRAQPLLDEGIIAARAALGEEDATAACHEGESLSLEQAVALVESS